jgi:shikimate kinase
MKSASESVEFTEFLVPHLYLIGYRGSGKTTVGLALARRLDLPFFDTDSVLEAEAGSTIREIFAAESEAGFRARETTTLQKLSSQTAAVISTGGGIVLRPENRAILKTSGWVVWLNADAEQLWHRISTDPTTGERRPNLTATGGLEEVRQLLRVREPLYRETANLCLDADRSPERIVADILSGWQAWLSSRQLDQPI